MNTLSPVRQTDAGPDPIRVIYLVGFGRSGSTVLDAVLGNHPDVVSIGEAYSLRRIDGRIPQYCSCGQPANQCEFWTAIVEQWKALNNETDLASYFALQQRFERLGLRQISRLAWERVRTSNAFTNYVRQTGNLYEAVCRVSGRRIIVDSTKNPLRAIVLARTRAIDLRLVQLVRDGRAVVWSGKKSFALDEKASIHAPISPQPAWRTISHWMFSNLLAHWVRRSATASSVLIRYEDFVSEPERALDRISQATEVDFGDVARSVAAGQSLPIEHTIGGNRLRMSGRVQLRADWEWMQKLPARDRRICWTIAGRLLRRYGYTRDPMDCVAKIETATQADRGAPAETRRKAS